MKTNTQVLYTLYHERHIHTQVYITYMYMYTILTVNQDGISSQLLERAAIICISDVC